MGRKSGFTAAEVEQIRKLYVDEGRTHSQIAKILGKGSETSVRNALVKAKVRKGGRRTNKTGNVPTGTSLWSHFADQAIAKIQKTSLSRGLQLRV